MKGIPHMRKCGLLFGTLVLLLCAGCGTKDDNTEGPVDTVDNSESLSTNDLITNDSEDTTTEDFVYYIDTIEIGEPQAEMSTKLFGGNFTAPLDLYEIAEFCLPLNPLALIRNETDDGWIEQFDTVEDAFIMDREVTHSLHYTLLSENEEANDAELYTISFRCYDDWDVYKDETWNWKTRTSIEECINRGLWDVQMCTEYTPHTVTEAWWHDVVSESWNTALGLDLEGEYTDEEVLDRMIELNGNPTLLLEDSIPNVYYHVNDTDIAYYLAWEYDEYTILMYIIERMGNPEILGCNYYTKELWENYKPYLIHLYEIDEL